MANLSGLNKNYGFTLIELMLVIALIAILISASLPTYQKYTKKAHYVEIINATAPLKLEVAECYLLQGDIAKCQSGSNGISKPITNKSKGLIKSIIVAAHGVIIITPNNIYGIKESEDYILTPTPENNGLTWKASGGAIRSGYTY
jgi:prepilin-type N-terminal cleavage/methylation domain-containing protein